MHVVGRGSAGIFGLFHRILHQPHGRGLQVVETLLQALGVKRQLFVFAVLLAEIADFLEERHHRAATVLAELAADQVECLDAVGAFIDHRNTGIADILAHAPFLDVAVAAEHLLRHYRMVKALVGQHALDHRSDQGEQVVCFLHVALDIGLVRHIGLERSPQHEGAAGLVEGADGHQRPAHVGMHDDRVGFLVGELGAGQRPALQTLACIGNGILIGDFAHRLALQADAEAGLVHHHEHRLETGIFLAD